MHIHFLIPCFGGQISEVTFTSFVRFIAKAPQWGLEWSLDTLVNESLIPRGRNALVAYNDKSGQWNIEKFAEPLRHRLI